ncbi:unnamed protein product [Adineta steineri]|uniref:Uncharacterized protein n=1 Tax=Adineta steineri TaxID=433720 RepID=A0A814ITN1_9BILA|nr:unnamed protein product [Adineta steineri]CAF1033434.1 unnamed protein product [Adineta steineri]CAF1389721.1 unnamed protein product [Adineta steineri]
MATIDEHICCHTVADITAGSNHAGINAGANHAGINAGSNHTGINAGSNHAGINAGSDHAGQIIQLGGTTPYVDNFQAAFNNQIGVDVPPIDNERRGVPPTDEDGLSILTTNEGKL